MDFTFGLYKFGPEYTLIGFQATIIIYLYKKLMDAKEEQVKAAREENERGLQTNDELQRTSDNIFTFVKSYTNKNSNIQKGKFHNRSVFGNRAKR